MASRTYRSLDALIPVRRLLDEADAGLRDRGRNLASHGVPTVLGTVAGVGVGTAAGAAVLSVTAASGTAGAAALTSGLAAAGSVIGGGMMAGMAVVAAPAVLLGIAGFAGASAWNARRLDQQRRTLLQEALRKQHAAQEELRDENSRNRDRAEYLHALVHRLEEVIRNLMGDLDGRMA